VCYAIGITRRASTQYVKIIISQYSKREGDGFDPGNHAKAVGRGQGFTVEYKRCTDKLSNSVFETVCSFSNRYLEGVQSVSIRDKIAREIVSNSLVHREYSSAVPARVIIEQDRVYTDNWNRSNFYGRLDPLAFTPYPKNPILAR
jgi:predicted HTH transcriptional regulator